MKVKKYQILIAGAAFALAAGLASCNVNDKIEDNPLVRFTAGIEQSTPVAGSRAAGSSWNEGDAVGVFMKEGSTVIGTNSRYMASSPSTGIFEADDPTEELYFPLTGAEVSFIAYYPYKEGTSLDTPLSVEIATAQTAVNQKDYDLLYSDNAAGYSKKSGTPVALEFTHKLAKLVIDCKAADNVGVPLEGMTVTVKGMNTRTTFDLSAGVSGVPETVADLTPRMITDGSAYDAIILPGSYADGELTVDFTVNAGTPSAETFIWDLGDVRFEGGYEYIYDVTLSRTSVDATCTIKPWNTKERPGVLAE